jgi:N-acetylglutamate synthase-like GNAT family acetyltransferase
MEIREAGDDDIPAIVNLLKSSLGEGLMLKSETYWRWKHVDNPFGRSPVLIAVEGSLIVGVRAFMCWKWEKEKQSVHAVRAVDTATHPDFQGRGIFSTLTKALLKKCEEQNVAFVFNTPNQKSLPGYIKMGWREAGRLPVRVSVRRPVAILRGIILKRSGEDNYSSIGSQLSWMNNPSLENLLEKHRQRFNGSFTTAHSANSLKWRYQDVPVADYFVEGLESKGNLDALFFYRLKQGRFGKEFRITDYFSSSEDADRSIKPIVADIAKKHEVDFVTIEGLTGASILPGLNFSRKGPIVTVRRVTALEDESMKQFTHWRPSVGDLELF